MPKRELGSSMHCAGREGPDRSVASEESTGMTRAFAERGPLGSGLRKRTANHADVSSVSESLVRVESVERPQ